MKRIHFLIFVWFLPLVILIVFYQSHFQTKTLSFKKVELTKNVQIRTRRNTPIPPPNNTPLNDFWNQLKLKLRKYPSFTPSSVNIGQGDSAKLYRVDKLFEDKDDDANPGSSLPNGKNQLQALVTDSVTVSQLEKIFSTWTKIKKAFTDYSGQEFKWLVLAKLWTPGRNTEPVNKYFEAKKNDDWSNILVEGKGLFNYLLSKAEFSDSNWLLNKLNQQNTTSLFWDRTRALLSLWDNPPGAIRFQTAPRSFLGMNLQNMKKEVGNTWNHILTETYERRTHCGEACHGIILLGDYGIKDKFKKFLIWNILRSWWTNYPHLTSASLNNFSVDSTSYNISQLFAEKPQSDYARLTSANQEELVKLFDDGVDFAKIKQLLEQRNNQNNAKFQQKQPQFKKVFADYTGYPVTLVEVKAKTYRGLDVFFNAKFNNNWDNIDYSASDLWNDFYNDRFSAKDLTDALVAANTENEKLWNQIRLFLKYWSGPIEWVLSSTRDNTELTINMDSLLSRRDQTWAQISDVANSTNRFFPELNSITLLVPKKLSKKFKNILYWNLLQGWLSAEYITSPQSSISIGDRTYSSIDQLIQSKDIVNWDSLSSLAKYLLETLIEDEVTPQQLLTAFSIREAVITRIKTIIDQYSGIKSNFLLIQGVIWDVEKYFAKKNQDREQWTFPTSDVFILAMMENKVTPDQFKNSLDQRRTKSDSLWNKIRPWLKFWSSPDRIMVNLIPNTIHQFTENNNLLTKGWFNLAALQVSLKGLVQYQDQDWATIISQHLSEQTEASLDTTHAIINLINYQLDNKFLAILLWNYFQVNFNKGLSLKNGENLIANETYNFQTLIDDQKETDYEKLSPTTKTLLNRLIQNTVTSTQLNPIFSSDKSQEREINEEKTNTNLVIGLGTAGGVVALAGVAGFVYWFIKIKK